MFITYPRIPDHLRHFVKRQFHIVVYIMIISLFPEVALAVTAHVGEWSITGLTPKVAQMVDSTKLSSGANEVTVEKYVNSAAALDGYSDAHLNIVGEGQTIHSSLQTISEYNKAGYRLLEYNGLILLSFIVFFAVTGALLTILGKHQANNRAMIFILRSTRISAVAISYVLIVVGYFHARNSIDCSQCSAEVSRRLPLLLWSPMLGILLISLIAFYTSITYRKMHDHSSNDGSDDRHIKPYLFG